MANVKKTFTRLFRKIIREANYLRDNRLLIKLHKQINNSVPLNNEAPVIIFNVSSRLEGISLNAAFSVLASLAVRASGVPVIHFVCQAGMSRCMQGTQWQKPHQDPPCQACIKQSKRISANKDVSHFQYEKDDQLSKLIEGKSLFELEAFTYDALPLGKLTLPSLRWTMRQHHLNDTEEVRFLFREFILSAWNIARQFSALVEQTKPKCVVVFNGQTFPEATVKYLAKNKGIHVVTHEVAIRPLSAFFSHGEATAYPIDIPDDFQLTGEQNTKLDQYLSQRFKGNFTMAGIRFWLEMQGLDESLGTKISRFNAVVPVFTNVVFDTSQVHANTIFETMFDWLDSLLPVFKRYPETLFVIRAHPDESRIGKQSRESVAQWAQNNRITENKNVVFIDSSERVSSYELIQRSKLVMIFNSTIGLEAAILGKPVLAAGRSRFTQIPTVHFPIDALEYDKKLNAMLADDKIEQPESHLVNARRFLYYQLYRTSLLLDQYLLADKQWPGYVHFRQFDLAIMKNGKSNALQVIADGIIYGKPFELPELAMQSLSR